MFVPMAMAMIEDMKKKDASVDLIAFCVALSQTAPRQYSSSESDLEGFRSSDVVSMTNLPQLAEHAMAWMELLQKQLRMIFLTRGVFEFIKAFTNRKGQLKFLRSRSRQAIRDFRVVKHVSSLVLRLLKSLSPGKKQVGVEIPFLPIVERRRSEMREGKFGHDDVLTRLVRLLDFDLLALNLVEDRSRDSNESRGGSRRGPPKTERRRDLSHPAGHHDRGGGKHWRSDRVDSLGGECLIFHVHVSSDISCPPSCRSLQIIRSKEVREKVDAELELALGSRRTPRYQDLTQLTYLTSCVKEVPAPRCSPLPFSPPSASSPRPILLLCLCCPHSLFFVLFFSILPFAPLFTPFPASLAPQVLRKNAFASLVFRLASSDTTLTRSSSSRSIPVKKGSVMVSVAPSAQHLDFS
eukprot:283237-Hanusia_phi.AAC.2